MTIEQKALELVNHTPPAADAEPVAWMYVHPSGDMVASKAQLPPRQGWTETPLYTADQLQAYGDARAREALARIATLEALVKEAGTAMLEGFGGDGVTEADREAAASGYYAWCSGNRVIPSKMLAGAVDDHSMVQAFARHRQLSAAAERARIVAALHEVGSHEAADAIERGEV